MRSCRPKVQISACGDTTVVRRVSGSLWDVVHLLCRSDEPSAATRRQAEAVYQAMLDGLAAESRFDGAILGSETLFLKAIGSLPVSAESCSMPAVLPAPPNRRGSANRLLVVERSS